MISNLLAGVGCITLLGAGCLALLAYAVAASDPGRMIAARLLARYAPPPRPAPDDLRPRGEK